METSNYFQNNRNDNNLVIIFSMMFILMFVIFCPSLFGNTIRINDKYSKCIENTIGINSCVANKKREVLLTAKYEQWIDFNKKRNNLSFSDFDKTKSSNNKTNHFIVTKDSYVNELFIIEENKLNVSYKTSRSELVNNNYTKHYNYYQLHAEPAPLSLFKIKF
ncbi:MAG: hypothetical protein EAZ07_02720 [Cytophagales bacterium]|nr:MAG: hypothetical protein EAZ07_02720 [Cytophagales bacterium]